MTDRIKKHVGEKHEAEFEEGPTAAAQGVALGKKFEWESRNKIEEEIMATLRGGEVNMIGIHGMGGVGKTTMAKRIMKKALDEHVFEEIVIATVTQNVSISKIQDEIGVQLGLEKRKDEKLHPTEREQILYSRLDDTKRILLVLDDVWEKPPLESIGIPKRCKILFTSRNRDVLQKMDDVRIVGMEVLAEEEAWSFFKERVGTRVEEPELKPTAKEVVKECGGMPINLAVVGAALKDKRSLGIWKDTLRKLKRGVPDNVEYDKESYNTVKWSYDYLDSKKAQSIFLLCCLFPEDADIHVDYLTNFCIGLGLFEGDITNMEAARNAMCTLTDKLKDRSLLLESDKKNCVRMHDVVRDVCILIAKEKEYICKDGCTWISTSHLVGERKELLSGSRCPDLRLLFLDSGYADSSLGFKFDDAFVEGMRELYVLHVENYPSLTRLPHPAQSLGKLNTLILYSCHELETISVVGELVNLEILICRDCRSIEKLPSEMKGLHRLKVLELTWCKGLQSIGRGIISSLIRLEELKMHESFKRWEAKDREERENAAITELETLPNLACLEIQIDDPSLVSVNMPLLSKKIVKFIIRTPGYFLIIPSHQFSKAMCLWLERETRLGDWIEIQLLRDSEYLYLRGGANNVDLAKYQNIRRLELRECGSMKNVVKTSGGDDATVFPLIEHLSLLCLPKLQEIWDGPISSTSFQNLKELELNQLGALTQLWKSSRYVPHFSNLSSIKIYECDSLHNLGQLSMARKGCLPHLQQLHIESCKMMEQVFLWNDEEDKNSSIESQQKLHVIFPKLKEVHLEELPNLTKVIEDEQQQERIHLVFPKLEILRLQSLPKLVSFCHWKCEVELPLLRDVLIYECPNMESFNMGFVAAPNVEAFTTDLKTYVGVGVDVAFDSLKELKIEENENPWYDDKISVSLFNGLEKLQFGWYKGSMSLLSSSVVGNLVNLTALEIYSCAQIVKVIEDEEEDVKVVSGGEIRSTVVFPKLEEIRLEGLRKLVSLCEWKCDVELPSLTKVEITWCPNMESFSMGFVVAPNLKIVKVDFREIDATKDLNEALHQHYLGRPEKEMIYEEEISNEAKDEIEEDNNRQLI